MMNQVWLGFLGTALLVLAMLQGAVSVRGGEFIWLEAEKPSATDITKQGFRPPYMAKEASGGDWLIREGGKAGRFAEYEFTLPESGLWHLYVRRFWRHGSFSWQVDKGAFQVVDRPAMLLDMRGLGATGWNLSWVPMGSLGLGKGPHTLRIDILENDKVAAFDCFCIIKGDFQARGKQRPDAPLPAADEGWSHWLPDKDDENALVDLRKLLNEPYAGSRGFITTNGPDFVYPDKGEVIRFWGCNRGAYLWQMPLTAQRELLALLARRGVNLQRLHGPLTSDRGGISGNQPLIINENTLDALFRAVSIGKDLGIYSELSPFFGSWFNVNVDLELGSKGKVKGFCWHLVHDRFIDYYQDWFRAVLLRPNPYTGIPLKDDPALAMIELVNESSSLWYGFCNVDKMHPEMRRLTETLFTAWLIDQHGSLEAAIASWGKAGDKALLANGAKRLVPSWEMNKPGNEQGRQQAVFFAELEKRFIGKMRRFLKEECGYQGLILSGNWHTYDPYRLAGLLQYAEEESDFHDRHGYVYAPTRKDPLDRERGFQRFYRSRSLLRAEGMTDGQTVLEQVFIDMTRNNKPSMCSEYNWLNINRFDSEWPLFTALLSRATGMDAMLPFTINAVPGWEPTIKENWPEQTPTRLGQYPAAALIFRRGLVDEGKVVADMTMSTDDAKALKARPISKPSRFDFNHSSVGADGAKGGAQKQIASKVPKALYFLTGQVHWTVGDKVQTANKLADLTPYWDADARRIKHSNGQIDWRYGDGVLTCAAEQVNVAQGFLGAAGTIKLPAMRLTTDTEFVNVRHLDPVA